MVFLHTPKMCPIWLFLLFIAIHETILKVLYINACHSTVAYACLHGNVSNFMFSSLTAEIMDSLPNKGLFLTTFNFVLAIDQLF